MPSINDIVQVAEALEKCPVVIVRDRCVAVRNRNASCRRCVEACAPAAISVRANEIEIDAAACVGCGACVGACPTETLLLVSPTAWDVHQAATASMDANGGVAVIACARIASKRQAPPERFAEVPCLAYVDETMLVELAASGAAEIDLVDGNCATCKHQSCMVASYDAMEQAERLLAAHGSAARIERLTGFPDEMRADEGERRYGSTRRGFFTEAAGAARQTVMTTAKKTLENELGYKLDEASIGERLRVGEDGSLPRIRAVRHEAAINAMDAIGQPVVDTIDTRLFGSVSIDVRKCNSCSMCATFCPTGALKRDPMKKPSDRLHYLEFSACDCVQCGLCADVCWKGALTLSSAVTTDELYDFEPAVFWLSRQP